MSIKRLDEDNNRAVGIARIEPGLQMGEVTIDTLAPPQPYYAPGTEVVVLGNHNAPSAYGVVLNPGGQVGPNRYRVEITNIVAD